MTAPAAASSSTPMTASAAASSSITTVTTPVLDRPRLQALVEAFLARVVAKAGLAYHPARAAATAAALAGELRDEVRAFLGPQSRHKIVAHVSVTERKGQGVARAAGCLWAAGGGGNGTASADTDGCGWAAAENDAVGLVAEVYCLYVH